MSSAAQEQITIRGENYNYEQLKRRSMFFNEMTAEDETALNEAPFDCCGWFSRFICAIHEPKSSQLSVDLVGEHISLGYMAAFYGVPGLLETVGNWLTELMNHVPAAQKGIVETIVDVDLPYCDTHNSLQQQGVSSKPWDSACNRLSACMKEIMNFFKSGCSRPLDLSPVCGSHGLKESPNFGIRPFDALRLQSYLEERDVKDEISFFLNFICSPKLLQNLRKSIAGYHAMDFAP
jgi:hypothetical protein